VDGLRTGGQIQCGAHGAAGFEAHTVEATPEADKRGG
jgi:hypothetical protein